jgi:uncharacterized protein (UPF0276 family)
VAAESFYDGGLKRLQALSQTHRLILHGYRLSLGSPAPLDPCEIDRFAQMAIAVNPMYVSAALGFSRVSGTDLGFPNPIPLNIHSLETLADHARQLMDACGIRLLFRNIAGHLSFASSMPEPEFLNRLCVRAECGLCIDLTSLYVQSRNHRFDAREWLDAIDSSHVVQISVGGCREYSGGWQVTHDCSPCAEVLELAERLCANAKLQAAVLERHRNLPTAAELECDLATLRRLDRARTGQRREELQP